MNFATARVRNVQILRSFVFLIQVGIFSIFSYSNAYAQSPNGTWQSKQQIWWRSDELVKDVIVSANALTQAHSSLLTDDAFVKHASAVTDLLLLFDSLNSQRSLVTLGSLAPYYLGESASETYSCLVKRKGLRINSVLRQMLNSTKNECVQRFGASPQESTGVAKAMCLSEHQYRERLRQLMADVTKGVPCALEK